MDKSITLELREVSCGYPGRFALKAIDLKVYDGEFLGIIGPNGSGKTTLLRAMSRILTPQKGMVFLQGEDIRRMDYKDVALRIAVVPQGIGFLDINVEEFVLLGRIPYLRGFRFLESKTDFEIAQKSLELTGVRSLKDRRLFEISGGERQLVLVARALAQEPKLLLLDEPTAHLDIGHQAAVLSLVKKLNRELGITVVIVLHDLNLASEYCHRLLLLDSGRVHKIGSPEQVLDYKVIEEVYKTLVVTGESPVSRKPYIFPVTSEDY